ncbi:hypothetical protein [Microcoleus sp. SVA1_B3]|uniref:hypothetical protein n=1 Tax=Microcoleus sp. SVA1_B3 TaxID=2818950 RepID=UPI002FD10C0E
MRASTANDQNSSLWTLALWSIEIYNSNATGNDISPGLLDRAFVIRQPEHSSFGTRQ